jgi:membrane protease YdiL (CAAX protease family)
VSTGVRSAPWGYWATFGWTLLAFMAGQIVGLAALAWWSGEDLPPLLASYDGVTVTLVILVSNPVMVAMVALAARLARWGISEYLALSWPDRGITVRSIAWLVVLIAICDALLYLSGRALVTPFQLEAYTSAAAAGWLPALWIATVIVAPAGEEVLFRGFMFRGWVHSERGVWPGIVAISLLWAVLHIQYDWTGMLQIFVIGLFLGWMRWRSGSTLLTFLLHAQFNFEGTLETVLHIRLVS